MAKKEKSCILITLDNKEEHIIDIPIGEAYKKAGYGSKDIDGYVQRFFTKETITGEAMRMCYEMFDLINAKYNGDISLTKKAKDWAADITREWIKELLDTKTTALWYGEMHPGIEMVFCQDVIPREELSFHLGAPRYFQSIMPITSRLEIDKGIGTLKDKLLELSSFLFGKDSTVFISKRLDKSFSIIVALPAGNT